MKNHAYRLLGLHGHKDYNILYYKLQRVYQNVFNQKATICCKNEANWCIKPEPKQWDCEL